MLVLNLAIALVVTVFVWYVMSHGLAKLIFAAESRDPGIAKRGYWNAFETAATLALFLVALGLVIGLTMLLEQFNR